MAGERVPSRLGFRTLRATVRMWSDGGARAPASASFMVTRIPPADPRPTREDRVRLWAAPGRMRLERDEPGGTRILVLRGTHWWLQAHPEGALTNGGEPTLAVDTWRVEFLLSTYWLRPPAAPPHTAARQGGSAKVAGRRCRRLVLRATGVPVWCPLLRATGAEEVELFVDPKLDLVLRSAARIGGRKVELTDMASLVVDEDIPDEVFEPPGGEFRHVATAVPRLVESVEEAAATVPFVLLRPPPQLGRLRWQIVYDPAVGVESTGVWTRVGSWMEIGHATDHSRPRLGPEVRMETHLAQGRFLTISQRSASDAWWFDGLDWEAWDGCWLRRLGGDQVVLRLDRGGTLVLLYSNLELRQLMAVASGLMPAGGGTRAG